MNEEIFGLSAVKLRQECVPGEWQYVKFEIAGYVKGGPRPDTDALVALLRAALSELGYQSSDRHTKSDPTQPS